MNPFSVLVLTFVGFEIITTIILVYLFKIIFDLNNQVKELKKEIIDKDTQTKRLISQTNKEITMVEKTFFNQIKNISK